MRNNMICMAAVILGVSLLHPLTASSAPIDLVALARQSKASFKPLTASDVAQKKAALVTAVNKLDIFLDRNGANGQAWKAYLEWGELRAQLKSGSPDFKKLEAVFRKFNSNFAGLEWPVYGNAGNALRSYIDVGRAAARKDLKSDYEKLLDELAKNLERFAANPTEEDAYEIGARLGWLESIGQAKPLVAAVRKQYWMPNLMAQASGKLLSLRVNTEINETAPVYDVILGAKISGDGTIKASLVLSLEPNSEKAVLKTSLTGTVKTKTVAVKGPATIWSSGTTTFKASKRLLLAPTGFDASRATADATTSTTLEGLSMRINFLTKMAYKRYYRSKPCAEQIAALHVEQRIKSRMDLQAGDLLDKGNEAFAEKFRKPLERRRAFPELMQFNTSKDFVHFISLQATGNQIAAPSNPPKLIENTDLAVRMHESSFNNLTASMLSGITVTDQSIKEDLINLLGKLPKEMEKNEDSTPWSMTFDRQKPMTVVFSDDTFKFTMRGRRFTSGKSKYNAMNILVTYKLEKTAEGSKLIRQGDVRIEPPGYKAGKTKLSAQQIALRTVIQRRLSKIFKPEIVSKGLVLKGEWKKVGTLKLAQISADKGWLTLAWITAGKQPAK